jgi:outer membrane protein insertion porin family
MSSALIGHADIQQNGDHHEQQSASDSTMSDAHMHAQQVTDQPTMDNRELVGRVINRVILLRKNPNKYLTEAAIKSYIPYKEGQSFNPAQTNALIKNLFKLGFFEHIKIRGEFVGTDKIDVYIDLDELPEVVDIELTGNDAVSDQKIEKELKLSELRAISKTKLRELVRKLRKIYEEKNYHLVEIDSDIRIEKGNKAVIVISIKEGIKSLIKRLIFKGNKHVRSKKLSSVIATREDWLLSFATKAGSYQPDAFEKDKRYLEGYYKTIGYLAAKVTQAYAVMDKATKQYTVTFVIDEGEQYTIKDIHVKGNEQLSEYELLHHLPMKAGDVYSVKDVMDSIEVLKKIFGEFGYIFVDIQPGIVPDEAAKTVSLSFDVELGDKVFLRRLNIKGNKKTRDHIIRRKIAIAEADLLTIQEMDRSKQRVESLSYWDKDDGVQWKIRRVNDHQADLDLIVKEAKTGKIIGGIGWGGNENMQSASSGFNWNLNIYDINFLGRGLQFNLGASWSKQEWSTTIDFTEPYLMDLPLLVGYNFHCNKAYRSEDLTCINEFSERYLGGSFQAGYICSRWSMDTVFRGVLGIDNIKLNCCPHVRSDCAGCPGAVAYQKVLDQTFKDGTIYSLTFDTGQDIRNHILHPSAGYQWSLVSRIGFPSGNFGFFKVDGDYSWYTSLIDEIDLVFCFHTHLGYACPIQHRVIPFKELYNIGGPASVRGFEWGEISPSLNLNPCCKPDDVYGRSAEPIGGRKAFFVNLELIFPIKKDRSIKGVIFYDGGSGWCPPALNLTRQEYNCYICNANFDYRQSIGFGIRMLQPQNISILWGFKLDRRPGEKASEVHFSTYREF